MWRSPHALEVRAFGAMRGRVARVHAIPYWFTGILMIFFWIA
jgi:hypothetical protein